MIIVDRKLKRKHNDTDFTDPFSLQEVHKQKARTIEARQDSASPIDRFLCKWGQAKLLIGKKAHALRADKTFVTGFIVDVMPPSWVHLKDKGVFKFSEVISLEE